MGKVSKSTTVLLVDDDRQEYLLIGYLLAEAHHEDYRLLWCKDLEEALDHIERKACDVVLLDYHWGGSSIGRDFLIRAKTKNSHIPIIVMTDEVEADVDEHAIREGASDYLTKSRINSQLLERGIRYAIERKQIEDRLDHLAHYDHLTDLPNRMLFLDRLCHSTSIAQREKNHFTLMFIDMDDFKGINDSYGHETGDKLLKQFSLRLSRAVRRSDTVARIGGDEFTVLLHNIGSVPQVMMLAQKIINETNQPYRINGHEFTVGCSIGIAVYPDAGNDEETLQRNADLAMYQAKQEPVSSYRFFSDALSSDIDVQLDLHRDFYPAMAAKQFGVCYVPRVDIKNNQITAIEIAPYWKHPEKGVLHYQHFSSICADNEMGKRLFAWLYAVGLHQFSQLDHAKDVKLVFNLDCHHFTQRQLNQSLEKSLKKYNVSGECVEIDLNQVSFENNIDLLESSMDNLQTLGISFGINGFGTELSSLLHLQQLPISTLKIDKRLVKAIDRNAEDAQLLKAVIEFSHRIGKKVVAESIETKAQLATLEKLGCDQCKGQATIGMLSFKKLQQALKRYSVQKYSIR